MRQIKFREYLDGRMRYFDIGQQVRSGIVGLQELPIMQYTGLKDKNGKEIYEGDIVRTNFDKTNLYEAYTEIGVVNITPYRTEIENKKHGKYNNFYSHSEIIGNVYKNPDLLK